MWAFGQELINFNSLELDGELYGTVPTNPTDPGGGAEPITNSRTQNAQLVAH